MPVERALEVVGGRVLRRIERHAEDLGAVVAATDPLHRAEPPAERHLRLVVEVQLAEHEHAVPVEELEALVGERLVVEQPVAVDVEHLGADAVAERLRGDGGHRSSWSTILDEGIDAGEVDAGLVGRERAPTPRSVTAPIGRGRAAVGDRAQVELHVLGHQRVGEPRRVAAGEHVVRELVARGGAAAARAVEHLEHGGHVEPLGDAERDGLAGRDQRGGGEEVVGQLHRLRRARARSPTR